MNELDLTHVTSLDSEKISIPGVNIEEDLGKTIALGEKKIRARKVSRIISISSGIAVVLLAVSSFVILFNSSNSTGDSNSRVDSASRQSQEPEVKGVVIERTPQTTPVTTPPGQTQPAPKAINPTLINILSFGDSSLCNVVADPNVNPGGVVVGPSTVVETWRPAINETKVQLVPSSGRSITIQNVPNNNAINGAFANLVSGFDRSSSFASVTTFGLSYCESGFSLSIEPTRNIGEYAITTVSL